MPTTAFDRQTSADRLLNAAAQAGGRRWRERALGQAPDDKPESGESGPALNVTGRPRGIGAPILAIGGGVVLLLFATVFLSGALDLRLGTAQRMGPGYLPLSLSILLIVISLVIITQAFTSMEQPEVGNWRPFVVISASLLVFAATIQRVGLVPSVIITTMVATLASSELRLIAKIALAIVLSVFCWLVFLRGLGMTIPPFRWPN